MCLEHENVGFDCAMVQGVIQPRRLRRCAVQCLPVLEADLRRDLRRDLQGSVRKGARAVHYTPRVQYAGPYPG
jgi:hypothetical protein